MQKIATMFLNVLYYIVIRLAVLIVMLFISLWAGRFHCNIWKAGGQVINYEILDWNPAISLVVFIAMAGVYAVLRWK